MASAFPEAMHLITSVGAPELWAALAVAMLVTYLFAHRRYPGRFHAFRKFLSIIVPSLIVVMLLVFFLKTVFPVARECVPCTMIQEPAGCNPYCPANDPGFPSGHAAVGFTAFLSLWLVQRRGWQLPVMFLPIAIAWSRVGLGVHTWLDVLAGSLIGIIVVLVVSREEGKGSFKGLRRRIFGK